MKELLTRNECTAMRGIAILAIVLHNYCHFISKIVQENEYQFFVSHNEQLWQVISHPDELLPIHLFSFFGHYGVPVFLFLSGYGLVRKYETSDDSCPPVRFVRYNYLKLLRMLFVGFSLFICVDMVTPGRFQFHWDNVIAQLLMYINVLPEPEKTIWPGIYWFFGLMMELLQLHRRSASFRIRHYRSKSTNPSDWQYVPYGLSVRSLRTNPLVTGIRHLCGACLRHEFQLPYLVALDTSLYHPWHHRISEGDAKVDAQHHHLVRKHLCRYVRGPSDSQKTLYHRCLETGYLRRSDALHHRCDCYFVGCQATD